MYFFVSFSLPKYRYPNNTIAVARACLNIYKEQNHTDVVQYKKAANDTYFDFL